MPELGQWDRWFWFIRIVSASIALPVASAARLRSVAIAWLSA